MRFRFIPTSAPLSKRKSWSRCANSPIATRWFLRFWWKTTCMCANSVSSAAKPSRSPKHPMPGKRTRIARVTTAFALKRPNLPNRPRRRNRRRFPASLRMRLPKRMRTKILAKAIWSRWSSRPPIRPGPRRAAAADGEADGAKGESARIAPPQTAWRNPARRNWKPPRALLPFRPWMPASSKRKCGA
ncbi:MAG: hypothetical protein BWZ10_03512 [candidate division BRC1 bacterium ADurb.BinA364]|nr:MAG: hypothetical protein BWZ10_03512 [candidate division BRC1 bacterium ADurb.BinA364]